jgi:hypothetical protein
MASSLLLICVLALSGSAHGFLFTGQPGTPNLSQFAQAQIGTLLNVRLDVGVEQQARMSITGLVLELKEEIVSDEEKLVALPGADGPNARASTGAMTLLVREEAYFIGMNGKQNVPLEHCCWEMVWREGAPSGVIVCGFNVPTEVRRNEASLPAGRLYLSFPVWTKAGLVDAQHHKLDVVNRARKHMKDKEDELVKMESTNNPFKKAFHFRNAAEATERYQMQNMERSGVEQVPEPEGVVPIKNDLLLATKGLAWSKEKSPFQSTEHTLLGYVTVTPGATLPELKP